jgi:hypothetical protein
VSKSHTTKLKRECRDLELEVIETDQGTLLVLGGKAKVTWWPDSRRMTAYAEGANCGVRWANEKTVIRMAMGEKS